MLETGEPGLRERGAFRNDQRDGDYEAYDRDGRLREKALYQNGKLVGKFMTLAMEDVTAGKMNGMNALSSEDMDGDREDREKAVDDLLKDLQNFNKP